MLECLGGCDFSLILGSYMKSGGPVRYYLLPVGEWGRMFSNMDVEFYYD